MKTLQRSLAPLIGMLLLSPVSQAENLTQIYQAALDSDPVISAQKHAFDAVSHSKRQTQARYYPNIDFNASKSQISSEVDSGGGAFSSGDFDYDVTAYSLSLRQPLYRGDVLAQISQSDASEQQAQAELNQAYQDLILRVTQAYFDVLAAQDSLGFAQAEKNAISRQLDQAKQRFEVGLIAITDVHEAQAAYDLAVASEIVAQNQLAISRQGLQELTGNPPGQLNPLGEGLKLTAPEPAHIDDWVNAALDNSFNIIAAEASAKVANQNLKLQRAGHHPSLDLVASYDFNDTGGGSFGSRETTDTSIGLQLNVPIYQGGGTSAAVRSANASLYQARDGLEQQRRATRREASAAYLSVLAGISQVKALQQAVTSSESALNATEAGYEVGTRTTVDVLNAQRELFRTQRDASRARYDYILASLRLQQAAGMLDGEDVQQINAWLN